MLAKMEKNKGSQGNGRVRSHDVTTLEDIGISKMQSSRWQKEAGISDKQFNAYVRQCKADEIELTQAGTLKLAGAAHVSQASGENEWYTPPTYIEMARKVMGGIDLDPASSEVATTPSSVFFRFNEFTARVAKELRSAPRFHSPLLASLAFPSLWQICHKLGSGASRAGLFGLGRRNLPDIDRIALATKREAILKPKAKENQKHSNTLESGLQPLPVPVLVVNQSLTVCCDTPKQSAKSAGVGAAKMETHGGDRKTISRSHDVTLNDIGINDGEEDEPKRCR